MIIAHNMMAINTHRQLGINGGNSQKSIEKLSSGLRINRAGDDAAGLAISEKMRSQVRGLNQASRNSQDGISMVQTAEGALQESQAILQRMRELAVQSSNDTSTDDDRKAIDTEIKQLKEEMDRIANTTEFNTQKLLDGSKGASGSSSNITAGVAKEISSANKIAIKDGSETKNNSITITIKDTGSADAQIKAGIDLTLDLEEKDYDNVVDFAKAFNTALTNAAADLKASGGADVTTLAANFNLGFDVDSSDGKVQFQLRASATATDAQSLSINVDGATISDELKYTLGTDAADITVTGDAGANAKSANFTNKMKTTAAGNAEITWEKLSIRLDDGKNPEVDQNNELKMKFDGLDLNVELTEKVYDGTAGKEASDLAADIKTQLESAIDTAVAGLDESALKAKGYKGSEADMKTAYKTDLKNNLKVGFNSDNKLEISAEANVEIDETSKAAIALGLTDINSNLSEKGVTVQIGANKNQTMTMGINDMRISSLGTKDANGALTATVKDIDVSTAKGSQNAMDVLDNAIKQVSQERSKLGAYQNRLEHTIKNLNASSENLTAAESRIRDVDMAKEMMNHTKNNILQQAAQAMLAQANQAPQGVLQLLR